MKRERTTGTTNNVKWDRPTCNVPEFKFCVIEPDMQIKQIYLIKAITSNMIGKYD